MQNHCGLEFDCCTEDPAFAIIALGRFRRQLAAVRPDAVRNSTDARQPVIPGSGPMPRIHRPSFAHCLTASSIGTWVVGTFVERGSFSRALIHADGSTT